jgi:hypothetical protein
MSAKYILLRDLVAYVMTRERILAGLTPAKLASAMEVSVSRIFSLEGSRIGWPMHETAAAGRIFGKNLRKLTDEIYEIGSQLEKDGALVVYSEDEMPRGTRLEISSLPLPKFVPRLEPV